MSTTMMKLLGYDPKVGNLKPDPDTPVYSRRQMEEIVKVAVREALAAKGAK